MTVAFEYLPVASALHDEAALRQVREGLAPGLTRIGGVEVAAGDATTERPLVVVALTGGTEQQMLGIWEARRTTAPWEPLLLLAHPSQNSLPAALETLARVHQDGGRGRIVYVDGPADERAWAELAELVEGVAARRALDGLRLGLIGEPSDWLVASAPPAEVVARRWGPEVVPVDMTRVIAHLRREPTPAALAAETLQGAGGMRGAEASDVAVAVRATPVLHAVADDLRLDALTVRCFDLVTDAHTSGCLALAELNDRGITAGCEGDIVSAVTMAWVRLLLGEVPWMANPCRVDVEHDGLLLAHCTIARSLVTGYRLRSHFESGLGVAIEGDIAADEVTLVRVGGADMQRLWVAEGRVEAAPHEEGLCRTQLHVSLTTGHVRDLLDAPLGNHLVVVPGHHADRLRRWWELLVA